MNGYQHLLTSASSLAMIFQGTGFNRGINDDEKQFFLRNQRRTHRSASNKAR